MLKNLIAFNAGAIGGNALPGLPFPAVRASARALPLKHARQRMTAAAAPDRHAGPPRTARFEGASDGACRRSSSHSGHAKARASPLRPSATLASLASHPRHPLRPLGPGPCVPFRRSGNRFFSTSEDDYLVEEDEEKAILEADTQDGLPLEDDRFYALMNADIRELHRLAFLVESSGTRLAEDVEPLLKKAAALPRLDDFPQQDVWWIRKFAQLNAIHDTRLPAGLRTSQLELNALTEQAVKKLLGFGRDAVSIRDAWVSRMRDDYSPEGKRNIWCEMMLWLLHNDQDAVLPALEATGRGRKAPNYVVADILEQFTSNHLQGRAGSDKPRMPPGLLPTFARLLEQKAFLGHALSQKFVHLVLAHSSLDQGTTFWRLLQTAHFRPSWHTLYHVAYFFGRHGEHTKALEVLRRPVELGAPPTHPAFLATCAQILRSSASKVDEYSATTKILSEFVSIGVSFNVYLYTIAMHNAVDHGDLQTALTVYRLMQQNGVEPNDYTYTVLLKGLKDNAAPELLRAVLRDAEQSLPRLERPRVVATDILHCVYLQHVEPDSTDSTFADLVKAFCEFFNPSTLLKLGVPDRFFTDSQTKDRPGMNAPPAALGIMLTAYLKLVSRQNPEEVVHLYRVFCDQIEHSGDHGLAALGKVDYFYNAFLLALGQNAATLPVMSEVLRHMSDPRRHAAPLTSKYTWDILVNAFMRHGQAQAAERVLEVMARYGQEPNEVTWNSLVRWYARRNDVDRVLETIRRMQTRRINLSAPSLRALGRLPERDKLSRRLQQLDALRQEEANKDQDYLVEDDYQQESLAWNAVDEDGNSQRISKPAVEDGPDSR